ncbi:hypothetical protein GCM10009092_33940 [Bowmanella denitrificans]|uniref:Uncharacterized protein n=1 Tax=Bowmanella denitrificans TaxID=366582 RepID=A0ABN0XKV5_9ALTE
MQDDTPIDDLIKGKRCIVVAPSGYLKGRGWPSKQFIESFDLVVKASDTCEIYDAHGELGSRCDIWYGLPLTNTFEADLQALINQQVKLMVLQPCIESYKLIWDECIVWLDNKLRTAPLQYDIADVEHYKSIVKKIGCFPYSGLFAIKDLLHRGASEVYAYGHDFFRTGYFKDSEIYDVINSGWHLLEPQMQAMWQLLKDEPRFNCDLNLKEILHKKYAKNEEIVPFNEFIVAELKHFSRLSHFSKPLIFRSFTADKFHQFCTALVEHVSPSSMTIVCQENFSLGLNMQGCSVLEVSTGQFSTSEILTLLAGEVGKFDSCFIPYNGQQLHTYLDIFAVVKELKIKNPYLVSTRGAMKRIINIEEIIDEASKYKELRKEFRYLQDKYDRKEVL